MKVGDLVRNGQGRLGIVTRVYLKAEHITNPDVIVATAFGKRRWSFNATEVISESR